MNLVSFHGLKSNVLCPCILVAERSPATGKTESGSGYMVNPTYPKNTKNLSWWTTVTLARSKLRTPQQPFQSSALPGTGLGEGARGQKVLKASRDLSDLETWISADPGTSKGGRAREYPKLDRFGLIWLLTLVSLKILIHLPQKIRTLKIPAKFHKMTTNIQSCSLVSVYCKDQKRHGEPQKTGKYMVDCGPIS